MSATRCEIVLIGGGLQNALVALAALRARPRARLVLIERGRSLGGNHTWCFHARDIPPSLAGVVDAITRFRWDGYSVRFPGFSRTLAEPYSGTSSAALAAATSEAFARAPNAQLRCGVSATRVLADRVELDNGEVLDAELVIDARGPEHARVERAGYQKFVGVELELATPHALARPVLMDATVPQLGGFRFVYVLPLAPDRVLVEDTTFARDPRLDQAELVKRCLAFARASGLRVERVARSEHGVLPMPWQAALAPPGRPLRAGYAGGWFHPATGYSFPVAARLAAFIAARPAIAVVGAELASLWRAHARQVRFCHALNRLVFRWFAAGDQWHVFERFYRLPAPVIRRFFALETRASDRARILLGRPPRGLSLRARLASGGLA